MSLKNDQSCGVLLWSVSRNSLGREFHSSSVIISSRQTPVPVPVLKSSSVYHLTRAIAVLRNLNS